MLECKAKNLNVHYRCCNKKLMSLLAKHDIYLSCWTARTEDEVRMLMNDDLRNITTQIPALALKIRDEILGQETTQTI